MVLGIRVNSRNEETWTNKVSNGYIIQRKLKWRIPTEEKYAYVVWSPNGIAIAEVETINEAINLATTGTSVPSIEKP